MFDTGDGKMKLIGNGFAPLLRRHAMWVRLALVVVTVCIAGPAVSVSADVLHQYAYDITGYIDTADYLIIQNSTLQWHHTDTGGGGRRASRR